MTSQFYLLHHHFKLGMAAPLWGEMGKLDDAANEKMAENWLGKGFYNHSFMPVTQEGPKYCVWEVKDGIFESAFQEFIDGPEGVNMRMKSINNNLLKIDLELTGGQTRYERKFA